MTESLSLLASSTGATFPLPLEDYPVLAGASLYDTLAARARLVPFNLAATGVFLLAVLHTFVARRFRALAHAIEKRHEASARAAGREGEPSVAAGILHFFGEVEVVFGLWGVALVAAIVWFYDWETAKHYVDGTVNFTEPLFVVVIMALAASRPVLRLAESALRFLAGLGRGTPAAWWLSILTVGPLLGSFITEPAAMTICALLLSSQFYAHRPSPRLAYATLGLLFVNVSVGGTLTHFAAPPVLMVARTWQWGFGFMLQHFGWRAVVGVLAANAVVFLVFRKELVALRPRAASPEEGRRRIPAWIVATNVAFMAFVVANAHYPALLACAFLFFLGFAQATTLHQGPIDLKPPLLVGFFLGGLVVHGGLQGWWIAPLLARLQEGTLFAGAAALTAFNDNALITYLATLVPELPSSARYAVVAGAVTGGGLTVIANAPNPAGQSILNQHFEEGISPFGLLLGALVPTLIHALAFRIAS
jgi:Na+/H+ antiporter NhaD/arsenite permease-like protein